MMTGLVAWLAAQAVTALDAAADIWPDSLFTMPDITALPQVAALSSRTLWVVNARFVLAIIAVGIMTMTYGPVQVRYSIKELANALTEALADQQITGHGLLDSLRNLMVAQQVMRAVIPGGGGRTASRCSVGVAF